MKRVFNIFSLAVILSLMVNLVGMPVHIARAADAGSLEVTGRNITISNNDFSPSTLDDTNFGFFNVNWTSPICHYFTVKNNGATTLTVSVDGPTSGEFQWPIIQGSGVIPAGGSTLLRVCFLASTTGLKTDTIRLTSDDPSSPIFMFDVSGTGTNSYAPSEDDTSVYMLGSVATKVVFVDGPTYNWAGVTGGLTKYGIEVGYVDAGLNYLEAWAPAEANLNFFREASTTVTIASDPYDAAASGDDSTWLNQVFDQLGSTGYGEVDRGRQYANDLRLRNHTDWGYTVFVILQPAGGSYVPWASEGGPYIVIPYAIDSSSGVSPNGVAHETAHVFGANDDAYSCDYNGRYGYMGARTVNCYNNPNGQPFGSTTLMQYGSGDPDPATGEQLGWWALDYNNYPPVTPAPMLASALPPVFTMPTVSGLSHQGTTTNTTLVYTGGIASDQSAVPHYATTCTSPDNFCYPRDVNINTIAKVEFSVDSGPFSNANAGDGAFNSDYEYFLFSTPPLSVGQHLIEVFVTSSSGIKGYWSDTVQVIPAVTSHTVTFHGNGNDGGSMSPQVASASTALTSNAFTRTGYTFAGWDTALAGTTVVYADGASYDFAADIDLYAVWTALPTYTVTFNSTGGTPASYPTQNVVQGGLATNPGTPLKTGFTFFAWVDPGIGFWNFADPVTSNLDLSAVWNTNSYTVSFDPQGGSPTPASRDYLYHSRYGGLPIIFPTPLPTVTWAGHTFNGWYDAPIGGNLITDSTLVTIAANHTLYAQWTAVATHTVTFHGNGNDGGSMSPQTTNASTALTANAFTRTNYTFAGWDTSWASTTVVYTDGASYDFAADIDLYAVWTANNHTVTFHGNGNDGGSMTPQTANDPALLTTNAFTRTGYTFAGWDTALAGTTVVYGDGAIYYFSADIDLYAVWTALPPTYTVTYDGNGNDGGTVPVDNNNYLSGQIVTVLFSPLPTKTGFTFAGWSDGVITYTSGGFIFFSSFAMGSSNVTLTAQWKANNHTVTFHGNGNDGGSMSPQVASASTALTANAFTRTGYTFAGWDTALAGTTVVYADGAIYDFSADVDLYAVWSVAPLAYPFSDNFESGYGNWSMTGLWNPEAQADNCGSIIAPFPSPSNAAYYGQNSNCTYNTGVATSGSMTMTAPVALPASGPIQLSFHSFESTEGDGSYDARLVEISIDEGSTWTLLGQLGTQSAWYQKTFDLSGYAGKNVLVRFTFDSRDASFNDYFGWMVDNVVIDTPVSHTVTFNANGGSGSMSPQVAVAPTALTANAFTYAGHNFTGWNTLMNGSGIAYANGEVYSFASDMTLYAQWAINPPGEFGKISPSNWVTGVSTSPTLSWGTSANAIDYEYCIDSNVNAFCDNPWISTAGATSVSLSGLANNTTYQWHVRSTNGVTYIESDTYSLWTFTTAAAPIHTVTFHANGGSGSMTPQTANASALLTTNAFTRTGYTFAGWDTDPAGATVVYTDGQSYAFSADIDLYAVWTAIPAPEAFTKTGLANGSVLKGTSVDLTWTASAGAVTYEYCMDETPGNTCTTAWAGMGNVLTLNRGALPANSTFYWQIRAVNGSLTKTEADGGTWWSFTLDNTAPQLSLPSDFNLEADTLGGRSVIFSASATDIVDGSVAVSCDANSGDLFPVGVTTVNCSATDTANNTGNGSFSVTITDTTDPQLSLPSDINLEADTLGGRSVIFSASATDLVDGSLKISCDANSGDHFPVGVTTVNCSATDKANNTANGSFTVTITDTTGPQLSLPADINLEANTLGGRSVTFSATATDLVDGPVTVSCDANSGDLFPVGATTVNCSATDAHDNIANGSFTVTITDTTDPQLSLPANITTNATSAAGAVVTFSATATDIVDGSVPVSCTPASGSTFPVGVTTVDCSATDSAGNTGAGSFTVTVQDATAPTVVSSVLANPSPTSLASVDFTVTFSESVTGVDMTGPTFDDFNLATSGAISGAAVSGVSGTGSVYTVTVNTGSGNGTIRLNVGTGGSIVDGAGNPLSASFVTGQTYSVIKAPTFTDIDPAYWAYTYIERLYMAGITNGCTTVPQAYCPNSATTRAQLAVMILRGVHGAEYVPPSVGGSTGFNDVSPSYWAAAWIKQLAAEGISSGCGGGNFCPDSPVTRAQVAIMLVRATHGAGFTPQTATGVFNDVAVGSFGADYIEQLWADGVTSGCGGGNFCPGVIVKRDQIAVFLVRAFHLP